MKKTILFSIIFFSFVMLNPNENDPYVPGTIVFKVATEFESIDVNQDGIIETDQAWFNSLAVEYEISKLKKRFTFTDKEFFQKLYTCDFPEEVNLEDILSDFVNESNVVQAFKDVKIVLNEVPNDEYYEDYQWPLQIIQAEEAWNYDCNPPEEIIVAMVDTGVDLCDPLDPNFAYNIHPDLTDNILKDTNGDPISYNVFSPVGFPLPAFDDKGHGTHTAGIVAATTDNDEEGISSLCGWHPNIKILPVKVFEWDEDNYGRSTNSGEGLLWAAEYSADIINNSWGSLLPVSPGEPILVYIDAILNVAYDNDCIVVASAGNTDSDWSNLINYPASRPGVINVAASNMYDEKAFYSTYADWVSITAPGGAGIYSSDDAHSIEGFISTIPSHTNYKSYYINSPSSKYQLGDWKPNGIPEPYYDFLQGTSMSGPLVSSLLALMKAKYYNEISSGQMDNDDLISLLYGTADNIDSTNPYYYGKLGAGRINAYKALTEWNSPHPNICIQEITFNGQPFLEAANNNVEMNILLKNWWQPNLSIAGFIEVDENEGIDVLENSVNWGPIQQYEVLENGGSIEISETDGILRDADAILHLEITKQNGETYNQSMNIVIPVRAQVSSPFAYVQLSQDENVTTELSIADIDNDGVDEMVFGSSFENGIDGNAYLYNSGYFTILSNVVNPITAKIALADLTEDGNKEIIAADVANNVYIWDSDGNIISITQVDCNSILSLAIEDVNDDGKLEIIGNGNNPAGVFIIESDFTNPDPVFFPMNCNGNIISEISIANVDTDKAKDGVFLFHNTQSQDLLLCKFIHTTSLGYYIITDDIYTPNDPDDLESYKSTNILLINRELDDNNNYSILFGLTIETVDGGINPNPETSNFDYFNYCFDFSSSQTSLLWQLDPNGAEWLSNPKKIIAGDYCQTEGIEIISASDETIYNIENNGTDLGKVYEIVGFGGDFTQYYYKPALILGLDPSTSYIFIYKNNVVKAYDSEKVENPFYEITLPASDEICSIAYGKPITSNDYDVYCLATNGKIFQIPICTQSSSKIEWSQFQNNSRNTGSYYQPLPEIINTDIMVKHDVIVDKNTKLSSRNNLTIEEDCEIRFEKNKQLNVYGNFFCIGSEEYPIQIGGLCNDETTIYWNGINFYRDSSSEIKFTTIRNAYTGLDYNDSDDHVLQNNGLLYNQIGVGFYGSSFDVYMNEFTHNQYGVCCDKFASPLFGYSGLSTPYVGYNGLIDNDYGVFINKATPLFENGFNDICGNTTFNMKYNGGDDTSISAQYNWWGSNIENQIIETLDPIENIIYDPWCDSPQTSFGNRGDSLSVFQLACVSLHEGIYNQAISLFQQVISDSISSNEDFLSMSFLNICYTELNQIDDFVLYIDGLLNSQQSDDFTKCLLHFKGLVFRASGNFDGAIYLYEDIILNNPSYIDSCYAVIDIGNTYLEANGRASGRLFHLQPESLESHQIITQLLLESIRTGIHIQNNIPHVENCVLHNNYPNPFNPETTISFSIPEDSKVNLSIYNIKGQKVKTLINAELEKGLHDVIWNSKDNSGKTVASGVYFYKFDVNGKTKNLKKMLLLK